MTVFIICLIVALLTITYMVSKSGEYRVRMKNSVGETPLVRGQFRSAKWHFISGWSVKYKEPSGDDNTWKHIWHPVSSADVEDCVKK